MGFELNTTVGDRNKFTEDFAYKTIVEGCCTVKEAIDTIDYSDGYFTRMKAIAVIGGNSILRLN